MALGVAASLSYPGGAAAILPGAKAGDLAVEQPTKISLIINFKTANVLGVTIAPTLLARVDHVSQ